MTFPLVSRKALESAELRLRELDLEYQNHRRRTAGTRETAYQQGRDDTALAFLPVYDNLLRALQQPCEDAAFVAGIEMTLRSLTAVLEGLGVTEIPALGEPFDPTVHEALDHITDPELGEGTVAAVALTGFRQGTRVLRPALVTVAN